MVKYKTWEESRAEARAEARAEESADSVLTVLRVRGIDVPVAARERILAEKDLEQLQRWLEKSIIAISIADVIDKPTAIVHEFPGPATQFRRAVPIERHRDVLALIDDVFTVLRSFVRPLVVEVTQVVMDSALGLPRPSVALDAASVAIMHETSEQVVINLTGLTTVPAVGRPMAACIAPRYDAPPGHLVAAASGYLMASAARLPSFEGDLLPLETRTGVALHAPRQVSLQVSWQCAGVPRVVARG